MASDRSVVPRQTSGRDPVERAVGYLLRSTSARPQTEAELRDRLAGRDVDTDVAERAIDRLRALGGVDDAAFAHAWVRDRGHGRGFGRRRLQQELRRRRVPEPLIDDALAELAERDDLAVATDLARTRMRALPPRLQPEAIARRLQSYLQRRGYPDGLCRRVAVDVSGLAGEWD